MAELQGEVQVLRFEKEHTGIVHQEAVKDLRRLQLDQEKHLKKVPCYVNSYLEWQCYAYL